LYQLHTHKICSSDVNKFPTCFSTIQMPRSHESSQQSSQHPQSGLLHGKWVKTQPYTCTHIKIPLKHMNTPNTNFQTLEGTFHQVPWTEGGGSTVLTRS